MPFGLGAARGALRSSFGKLSGAFSAARDGLRSYSQKLGEAEFVPVGDGRTDHRRLGYQPALEGLRSILLLGVVLQHTQKYLVDKDYIPLEGLGVMSIFFILSGFLVSAIIVKNLQQTGSVQYRSFVWRRVKRLYGPVILFVAVYLVVNIAIGGPFRTRPGAKILGVGESALLMLTSTINLAPTFGYSERFDSVQMWSLGVDMQLYLLLPVIIYLLFRYTRNLRKLLGAIAVAFIGLQILRVVEYYFLYWRLADHHTADAVIAQSAVYERPENSAGAFLVGMALYLVWSKGLMPFQLFKKIWIPITIVLCYLIVVFNPVLSNFSYWIGFTIVSIIGGVVVAEALREGSPIRRAFSGPTSRLLGRVSYTVYIWHMLVLILFNRWVKATMPGPLRMLGAWVVLAVVSAAAWWIAERPLVRLPPVRATDPGEGDRSARGRDGSEDPGGGTQ